MKRSLGQWWFSIRDDGGTHVVWRHSLEPRNAIASPFVWLFVKTMYRPYVRAAMRDMARISEQDGLAVGSGGGSAAR